MEEIFLYLLIEITSDVGREKKKRMSQNWIKKKQSKADLSEVSPLNNQKKFISSMYCLSQWRQIYGKQSNHYEKLKKWKEKDVRRQKYISVLCENSCLSGRLSEQLTRIEKGRLKIRR